MDNSVNQKTLVGHSISASGGEAALGKYVKFPAKTQNRSNGATRRADFSEALRARLQLEGDEDSIAVLADSDRFGADASSLCLRFALQSQARLWAPEGRHPIKRCHRFLIPMQMAQRMAEAGKPMSGRVEIWSNKETRSAHLRGLETCKSVWACPVCSARLMERRTNDLQTLVSHHTATGGILLHVTFTVPHAKTDSVKTLVKTMAAAYNAMGEGRAFKDFRKFGTVGDVRALEVTYGLSAGFHPHYHVLYFLDPGIKVFNTEPGLQLDENHLGLSDIRSDFYRWWSAAAVRSGLGAPSEEHGVRVTIAESQDQLLAGYISKFGREPSKAMWGVEAEMVKGHAKIGSDDRFHPFDFLRAGMLRDKALPWNLLWADYREGFKGQQQLRGLLKLAKRFGIDLANDDEVFNATPDDQDFGLLAQLDAEEWKSILVCGARGLLLDQAKRLGKEGIDRVLAVCQSVYQEVERNQEALRTKQFFSRSR